MASVILLDENLAAQLKRQAEAKSLSVEQYAREILGQAVATETDLAWRACNERRVALIRRQFSGGLTGHEEAELRRLQEQADEQLDQLDEQRLADVRRLRSRVEQHFGFAQTADGAHRKT